MKKLIFIKLIISAVFMLSIHCSLASETIKCHTPRMSKGFVIKDNSITFYSDGEYGSGRALASISKIRTKREMRGFTKVTNFEGHKYIIHISDLENFSDVNDYVVIKSRNGHNITYPIVCKSE